ncbi:MAG: oligosaccharide flippase family protein [Oscillospiraceae bacterium]|nr:oligosaccharide flippase family protein [Oscillospiraceae bacterium]
MIRTKKIGAVLSYFATILNSLVSIFLTPFILGCLGDSEYGIYRTVQALTGQLALISIGIGTIASVFVAKYNARTDAEAKMERENFLATGIFVAAAISVLVMVAGMILYLFVDDLYAATMTAVQIRLVQDMYVLLVINVSLYLFRDVFVGVIHGCERFIYSNGLKVLRLLLRVAVILLLLNMGFRALALVWCDLLLTVFLLLCDVVYCFGILKLKAKFHVWDRTLFGAIFSFSLAMFLQTIVNQVNQNLDSVILGATIAPERVAVYSLALTIYVAFNGLTTSVAGLFTPQAARMIQQNASADELMEFTVKVGRMQSAVVALGLGGFICAGQPFVSAWVGADKLDVYYLSLILLIPSGMAVLLSGANSILDGMLKRIGRSLILIIAATVNVLSSLFLIHFFDYWGAAIGTALSVVAGQIFAMCLYYRRVFGFKPLVFFKETFRGILPCALMALVVTAPLSQISCGDVWLLLIKGAAYVAAYGAGLWLFGLNTSEKKLLLSRGGK